MHTLVVDVAKYAIFLVAVVAVIVWLLVPRAEKIPLAVQAVVGVVAVLILIWAAGKVHSDPRPFVQNPHLKPYFPHPADNGFPSDHTAVAAAVAFVVAWHRKVVGALLVLVSAGIGAARVAAHVHHVQDIVGGLVLGLVAAAIAVLAWHLVARVVRPEQRYNGSEV